MDMILPGLGTLKGAAELVYCVMAPAPQIRSSLLCARAGAEVWVECENRTAAGAFKDGSEARESRQSICLRNVDCGGFACVLEG